MTTHDGARADKRKARAILAALATASAAADAQAAALTPSTGLSGYFVAGDAWGDPIIWHGTPDDHCPKPVNGIDGWRVQRDHPDLWAAIVRVVGGAS